ncbi:hemolysin III family protein [bacterium]|nr:hemolysin III family protein [bacterium]
MKPNPKGQFTTGEEIAHSITHGVGALLSAVGLVLLVVRAVASGDPWRVVSFAIYGATLVLLYTASTLYHALTPERAKSIFNVLDHAFIYLLIAGSYTPMLLVSLRGPWGWSLFGVVWGLAITGGVFKIWFTGRFRRLSTLLYIGLSWLCVIAIKPLLESVPPAGLIWLLAGGVAYTGGSVFYLWRGMRFHHAIWHVFVLIGSACHFVTIYEYLS